MATEIVIPRLGWSMDEGTFVEWLKNDGDVVAIGDFLFSLESEKAIQDSLEKLTNNRTTLVIAHRLSTVRNAQRIIVITENGIDEQGTHDELIALDGSYAKLHNVQLSI